MIRSAAMYKYLFLVVTLLSQLCVAQDLESDLEQVATDYQLMGMSVWVSVQGTEEEVHVGLRDFDRDLPVNELTQYRIASISKAISALGLLKLYDQGAFELDDDISNYLGYTLRNPNHPNTPITFRMVLSHQSGLQDGTGYANFLNATYSQSPIPNINELLLAGGSYFTANMWRTETPGSYFVYSNINFGLIGTLIEAISQTRFDIFMKTEVLEPLNITGSYNIQDLTDINNVSVLYRNVGGIWTPQNDNYQGTMPTPPDLTNYDIGTNGAYFAPQGGLRASASDLGLFLNYLNSDGTGSTLAISEQTLLEMKAIAFDYNGSNGDNYGGLFNRWGLGLHHANVNSGDQICNLNTYDTFIGHPGEAYGLISDAYVSEAENVSFSLLINGSFPGYDIGNNSSYYTVEEAIFEVLCEYFGNTLSTAEFTSEEIKIATNPIHDILQITLSTPTDVERYVIYNIQGRVIISENDVQTNNLSIEASTWNTGVYFIKLTTSKGTLVKKLIKHP